MIHVMDARRVRAILCLQRPRSVEGQGPVEILAAPEKLIEAVADSMTATPATDATVCLVENHNPLATMKLKLLQNSQANSVLADFERNKTVFSVMLQESNAPDGEQVRAQAEAAFVKKQAPIKRGNQHIATEWEIQLIRPKLFNGGLDDGTV